MLSSLLFGLMHLLNVALGAPFSGTIAQVAIAFGSGTAFYILRRVTGSLIAAMVLHGLWDVSVFAVGFAPKGTVFATLLAPVIAALSLAVVYSVIKGTNENPISHESTSAHATAQVLTARPPTGLARAQSGAAVESFAGDVEVYLSLHTALHLRGLIEQIPEVVYAVSLDRTSRIVTPMATFSIHHLAPEVFGGYEQT